MLLTLGFNTQPPEGGWLIFVTQEQYDNVVSTHSRLKAAGRYPIVQINNPLGFNTQPPEGGW